MRSEYPSGLVPGQGPGIGRSPVRFPAPRILVWDNFLINFKSFFHKFWDVLGCVWEWFGDIFGWIWDGFGKNVGRGRNMKIVKKMAASSFLSWAIQKLYC